MIASQFCHVMLLQGCHWYKFAVPPTIISQPNSLQTYHHNERQTFSIFFKSKSTNNTLISWYKDGRSLQDNRRGRKDIFNDRTRSLTQLTLDPIRRTDEGHYRVVIENNHPIIPADQRRVEVWFSIEVMIPPSRPLVNVRSITNKSATVFWTFHNMSRDEAPDNLTITLHHANGTLATQLVLADETRAHNFSLVPGQSYRVQVVAQNEDGVTRSEQYPFQTLPGGKIVCIV